MAAKDKAKELFDKYFKLAESIEWTNKQTSKKAEKMNDKLGQDVLFYWNELAKKSALIAVDEILDLSIGHFDDLHPFVNFWQQVKQEIINQ
jgi:hypothetical protein